MRKLTLIAAVVAMAAVASAQIYIPNGQFTAGNTDWAEANGGSAAVFSYPATGGVGNSPYGQIEEAGGGWAVLVSPTAPGVLGGGWDVGILGVTPGTTETFTIDLKTFAGTAGGGLKVEAWGANVLLGNSGDVNAPGAFADWTTFTFDWAVPLGTDKMIFVPLWGSASTVGFDNVGVVPEPATLGLLGIGAAAMVVIRRRCA